MHINPFASPSAGAPALKYGYVNTVTTSPSEVKGLMLSRKSQLYFFREELVLPQKILR